MSFTESLLNWIGDRIFLYAVYTVVTTVSFTESSLQLIAEHELIYEALEMLASSLQHTAQHTKHERQNFYRLVYQTVRGTTTSRLFTVPYFPVFSSSSILHLAVILNVTAR